MKTAKAIGSCFFVIILAISFSFLAPHLRAADQSTWDQLIEKANVDFEQEEFESAVEKAGEALAYAEREFGPEHPQTVYSLYLLGSFYSELGYAEEALPLFENALQISIKLSGESNGDTVMIMSALAQLYGEKGRYEEASTLLTKAQQFYSVELGTDAPETLSTIMSLAQTYEALGQFQQAETLYKQAIEAYTKTQGTDHPDTLFARESLASTYQTQGQFELAREILEEVLEKRTSLQGEKSPDTLYTLAALAELNRKTGNFDTAEVQFQEAIASMTEIMGPEDADLHMTMSNLALLYQDQGQYPEAESLYRKVWEFDAKTLGEKHPNTIIDLNNLAGIYRVQGQYGAAEDAYTEALSYIKEALGETHPETISIMNNLGLLYENLGLYDKAEPLFKTALKYANDVLGEKHPTSLALMNNLASLYESQGVFERSEPLYRKTILFNVDVYGPDHPNTVAAINNLAYLYLIQFEYDKAEPLFSQVLENWQQQLGEKHQKTLKALNNLARVYHKQGKTDDAEAMFLKTLRLRKEVLGSNHPDVVRSMVDLSALYHTQKKLAEAEALLIKTIYLSEEILGDKHPYTFEALNNLADVYESRGEIEKALEIRRKSFDRRTEFFERVLWAAGENTRQSYIQLHKHEQDNYLKLLVKMNREDSAREALHTSLQRKGILLKITSEIHRIVEMSDSPQLAAKANALNNKRKQLASMTLAGPTGETPEEFRKTLVMLENELEELQAELGRASVIYHLTSQPISVDRVFQNLNPEDVLVDFITYTDETPKMVAVVAQTDPEKCFVWWNCIGNKITMVPLGELEDIRQLVAIFRETIQDEDAEEEDIFETGHDVFLKVWKPLQKHIGNKSSIYIVPDSALHLLPFDAMVDDNDNYLIENKDLKVMSSSRDLVVSNLPDAQGQFMILAGPDYDMDDIRVRQKKQVIAGKRSGVDRGMRISHGLRSLSFEPLLGAEVEGQTIKKVSDSFTTLKGAETEGKALQQVALGAQGDSVIYLKRDAEEQQLRSMNTSPQMLHIATHGFFLQAEERLKKRLLSLQRGGSQTTPPPGDNPLLRAGLAFAGINSNAPFLGEIDTDNDGVLTALEVLNLRLTGTQLVVLSACETGVGEIHAGEGVYGLRRAFQEAGVKSVVNSLWPVSDEGTRRLMTAFYQNIYKGLPPRKALKAAQLSLLQSEWNSPYYWSAFVMVERRFATNP